MSKFCTWISLSMNTCNLIKFLRNIIRNNAPCSFSKHENVVLCFEEFSDFFVLLDELWLKRMFHLQTKVTYVLNNGFSFVLDFLTFRERVGWLALLVVWEPKSNERKANDTWNETFDGAVTESWFHVESNVLISFSDVVFTRFVTWVEEYNWWFFIFLCVSF